MLEVLVHQTLAVLDSKLWEIPRFLLLKSTQPKGAPIYFRTRAEEEDFISEYSTFSGKFAFFLHMNPFHASRRSPIVQEADKIENSMQDFFDPPDPPKLFSGSSYFNFQDGYEL